MNDCIFCKIINGEIPSKKVYETDKVYAFHDINPEAPVHVLIVPKEHIASHNELSSENVDVMKDIHLAANEIARKLGISESGYRLINNCGADAGQTVFHLHYHLAGGTAMGSKIL
ncbi:histidine triad nucleotide-binding protein [Ruminiclostridium cellulolyticum]|uniref:Histidine triad (HIT) protein n=1 Tax=Ruminiclostridium cellulolyticum (strain ATCC 35319 / DSM 5812 / JCM 6584 / H10) TaxID=394503 RepID=B8I407_RUMCH|nr:histidine triad nucleotide-binding protein [Ruminiclostridium cellulolyticum]ACL76440.1 histidine triad (HIT) protein [Ruminiclostridium cellulolyticum H10]